MKKKIYIIIGILIIALSLIFYFKNMKIYKGYIYTEISNDEIMIVRYV